MGRKVRRTSRLYFGERNMKGMLEILEPLHNMLDCRPQTLKETSFCQAYGRDLTEASGWTQRYKTILMLDRMSGTILHIDFGDCWEVAMTCEKFPAKIPFRLTRMLIKAMEVTGIGGTYRRTCENVMVVLRRNKDSLMTVLEAFVYEPLLYWRLLDTDKNRRTKANNDGTTTIGSLPTGDDDESVSILRSQSNAKKPFKTALGIVPNNTRIVAEVMNSKARRIVERVKRKLTGTDFQTKNAKRYSERHYGVDEDKIIFSSSGREDVYVRCLDRGRPFFLEIPIEKSLQISVKNLQMVTRGLGIYYDWRREKEKILSSSMYTRAANHRGSAYKIGLTQWIRYPTI